MAKKQKMPVKNIRILPNSPVPNSLAWRRARGLMTRSDYGEATSWDDENLIGLPKRQSVKPAIPIQALKAMPDDLL